jgi:hypothetical protein
MLFFVRQEEHLLYAVSLMKDTVGCWTLQPNRIFGSDEEASCAPQKWISFI